MCAVGQVQDHDIELLLLVLSKPSDVLSSTNEETKLSKSTPSFNIDSVVNLAGLIRGGPLMEIPAADVSLVMRVNVEGTHNLNRALFNFMNSA